MRWIKPPLNPWGWARLAGLAALGLTLLWTLAAAGLRQLGAVDSLAWSGYATFTLLKGFEFAVAALFAVWAAAWLEDQDELAQKNRQEHLERVQALAAQREQALRVVRQSLPAAPHDAPQALHILRGALETLDPRGKGGLLGLLHEMGWLPHLSLEKTDLEFQGAFFDRTHAAHIHLEGLNLTQARFHHAHLHGAHLARANLTQARCTHADLREADLSGCDFKKAQLEDTHLEGADLRGAYWRGAVLQHVNFRRCRWDDPAPASEKGRPAPLPAALESAVVVDCWLWDGRKVSNENGRKFQRQQEISDLANKL